MSFGARPALRPIAKMMMSPARLKLSFVWACAALVVAAACSAPPAPPPVAAGGGKKVDSATAGAITGHVTFTGTPPAPDVIRVGIDTVCAQESGASVKSQAVLVGADGSVQNAFV